MPHFRGRTEDKRVDPLHPRKKFPTAEKDNENQDLIKAN
jgi:hypothetical protein